MYFVVDDDDNDNNFNHGTHMPIETISDLNTDMIFTIMFQRCDRVSRLSHQNGWKVMPEIT